MRKNAPDNVISRWCQTIHAGATTPLRHGKRTLAMTTNSARPSQTKTPPGFHPAFPQPRTPSQLSATTTRDEQPSPKSALPNATSPGEQRPPTSRHHDEKSDCWLSWIVFLSHFADCASVADEKNRSGQKDVKQLCPYVHRALSCLCRQQV